MGNRDKNGVGIVYFRKKQYLCRVKTMQRATTNAAQPPPTHSHKRATTNAEPQTFAQQTTNTTEQTF